MTATATFTRRPPVAPAFMREANAAINGFNRALNHALAGRAAGDTVTEACEMLTAVITRQLTAAERVESDRYNREVREYNAAVTAHNQAAADRRQARRNAAEVAAVRNAACTRCFSTHPGEC